jgi:leucyl aminopeptidase
MNISVANVASTDYATPLLAVSVFESEEALATPVQTLDERMNGAISEVIRRGDFKGKDGQTLLLYPRGAVAAERVLLVGLGKRASVDAGRIRNATATAAKAAARLGMPRFATLLHHTEEERVPARAAGQAMAEGAILGSYVFDQMKTVKEEGEEKTRLEELVILVARDEEQAEIETGARVGSIVARAENFARTLGNLPGNVATPTYLAEAAEEIGLEHGQQVTILGPAELEREGLRALLAVAQGSAQEPRLIVIEHRRGPAGEKPLVLVGKGLTFDAGGISIKPAQGMEEMKFDMCGGAAVLGAMQAIGELGLERNVVGIVASSENLLGAGAMKPGDVIGSHLGKTIEVVNTDAEGRLILADALSYARRYEPAAVLDAATLTGACVIALGHHASAVMGNDEALIDELRAAGDRVGQRVWPLPMYEEYHEQIRSDYGDVKNTGGRPGGAITAGWFLREFVGDFPWAHLDIAGTAWGEGKLPTQTKGATGVPTRLFVEWVLARAG